MRLRSPYWQSNVWGQGRTRARSKVTYTAISQPWCARHANGSQSSNTNEDVIDVITRAKQAATLHLSAPSEGTQGLGLGHQHGKGAAAVQCKGQKPCSSACPCIATASSSSSGSRAERPTHGLVPLPGCPLTRTPTVSSHEAAPANAAAPRHCRQL